MSLIKNPNEREIPKAFGYTTEREFLKECDLNKRMAALAGIMASLQLMGTRTLFAVIAFMEVTTGLKDLRYGNRLLEYVDKSLNEEEVFKLSIMLLTLQSLTEDME